MLEYLQLTWLFFFDEPPWRDSELVSNAAEHWFLWLLGWSWALSGLIVGALYAPAVVSWIGLSWVPYQDTLYLIIACVAALLVQLVAWTLVLLIFAFGLLLGNLAGLSKLPADHIIPPIRTVGYIRFFIYLFWPCIVAVYVAYSTFVDSSPSQRSLAIAIVGGVILKGLMIPFIRTAVSIRFSKAFLCGYAARRETDLPSQSTSRDNEKRR